MKKENDQANQTKLEEEEEDSSTEKALNSINPNPKGLKFLSVGS